MQILCVLLLVLALPSVSGGAANAQNADSPSSPKQHVLYLNGGNNGQHVTARIGQAIQIRLQTIGPGYYGTPEISSSAVRFESETSPKEVIPAAQHRFTVSSPLPKGRRSSKSCIFSGSRTATE